VNRSADSQIDHEILFFEQLKFNYLEVFAMKLEFFNPPGIAKLPKPASHAALVEGARLIAIAGQIATDVDGNVVGEGDVELQTRQVLDNMTVALKAAGAGLENVFKVNIYMTDISQIGKVLAVRQEYFRTTTPAATAIEVKALVRKELLVEIEAMAIV
jgi:enamine deaminase RidA (YjgF/YER057c/UK114 family)